MPLYGDMQINPFSYVNNKHIHYDASKWPLMSGSSQSPEADIVGKGSSVIPPLIPVGGHEAINLSVSLSLKVYCLRSGSSILHT